MNDKKGGTPKFVKKIKKVRKKKKNCIPLTKNRYRVNLEQYTNPKTQNIKDAVTPWVNIIKKFLSFETKQKKLKQKIPKFM